MVSGSDPVESFFNSVQVVKDSLSPLEVGIRKAAKDLEHCLAGSKNKVNGVCLIAPVRESGEFQICLMQNKVGIKYFFMKIRCLLPRKENREKKREEKDG